MSFGSDEVAFASRKKPKPCRNLDNSGPYRARARFRHSRRPTAPAIITLTPSLRGGATVSPLRTIDPFLVHWIAALLLFLRRDPGPHALREIACGTPRTSD